MPIAPIAAADDAALHDVAELAAAFAPSRERHLETTAQGAPSSRRRARPGRAPRSTGSSRCRDGRLPIRSRSASRPRAMTCRWRRRSHAYLHAFAANLVSAGVRLVPLGQTDGQRVARRARGRGHRGTRRSARARRRSTICRRRRVPRRSRQHAPRNPVHEAVPLMSNPHGPAARRHRRPGRLGQDRADGRAVQAHARPLRDRRHHQRHLHQGGRRVS